MIRPRVAGLPSARAVAIAAALALGGGLVASSATLGRPAPSGPAASAKREAALRERLDLVGEGHPTGGVRAQLQASVFPERSIVVSMPAGAPLASGRIHVIEDGVRVPDAAVLAAGTVASQSRAFELDAPPVTGARSEYLIQYRSTVPAGEHEVELSVALDGVGAVDLDYDPGSSAAVLGAPAGSKSFWRSATGLIVISAIAALLIALGLAALLGSRRRTGVQRRVGEFTTGGRAAAATATPTDVSQPLPGLERILGRFRWWPGFAEQVEVAGFRRTAAELLAITLGVTLAVTMLVGLAVGTFALTVVLLPLGPLALRALVRQRLGKQRQLFADQLAPHLEELASAMRAGHGLIAALASMVNSAAEPSRKEWGRALADEQLGMPLEQALQSLARRTACDDVEQVALVASLHSRTGGNMAEVLDRVAEGVRERSDLRRELRALTSQARLSRWIVTGLPPALLGVIALIDPAYMSPLLHTTTGIIVMVAALVMLVVGSMVMRNMTDIKV